MKDSSKDERQSRATINDVAAESGVSKGTVSHYISGRVPVSPKTRQRIEAAMTKLNYRPTQTARSLNSRKRLAMNRDFISSNAPRLTTVGYVSIDVLASVSRLPKTEERLVSSGINMMIGGVAANVASVAAGIGEPWPINVSILTVVGQDQDSDWALSVLADRRVSVIQALHPNDGRITRALIFVEQGGRRTIVNEPIALDNVDVRSFIHNADVTARPWCLHFEGYVVATQIDVIADAREKGMITSMHSAGVDLEWLRDNGEIVCSLFDYMVLSREALTAMTGLADAREGLLELHRRSRILPVRPQAIVVTLGAQGAIVINYEGLLQQVQAPRVVVTDTTGAGDSFVGAFLTLILHGADPLDAAQLACISGSMTVTTLGAAEMRPSASELLTFARTHDLPVPKNLAAAVFPG
jgi:ribokinase